MWRRYFKLVKLVPGKVIVQGYGTLDFSGSVPIEVCKELYENDFEFLEITDEGKRELYGIEENPPLIPPLGKGDEEPVTSNKQPVKPRRKKKKDD